MYGGQAGFRAIWEYEVASPVSGSREPFASRPLRGCGLLNAHSGIDPEYRGAVRSARRTMTTNASSYSKPLLSIRAAFLASPVSGFTSGTNLVVDGALTRGVQL